MPRFTLNELENQDFRDENFDQALLNAAAERIRKQSQNADSRSFTMLCLMMKWIAGIVSALTITGVVGLVGMYAKLGTVETTERDHFAMLNDKVDRALRLMEPHYRGVESKQEPP